MQRVIKCTTALCSCGWLRCLSCCGSGRRLTIWWIGCRFRECSSGALRNCRFGADRFPNRCRCRQLRSVQARRNNRRRHRSTPKMGCRRRRGPRSRRRKSIRPRQSTRLMPMRWMGCWHCCSGEISPQRIGAPIRAQRQASAPISLHGWSAAWWFWLSIVESKAASLRRISSGWTGADYGWWAL